MIKIIVTLNIILSLFLTQNSFNSLTEPEKLKGYWYAEDLSKSTVAILPDKNGLWSGIIIKSEDKEKIGKIPIQQFKYNTAEKKFEGIVSPPGKGISLSGTIKFIDENNFELVGKMMLMKKTYKFNRIK